MRRGIMTPVWFVLLIAPLAACTNKQLYNAVQHNQQLECSKLPQVRYEHCMQDLDGSYEDYEREREALIREGQE